MIYIYNEIVHKENNKRRKCKCLKNVQIGITDYTEIYLQQKTIDDDVNDDDDDDDEHQLQTEQQANRHLV